MIMKIIHEISGNYILLTMLFHDMLCSDMVYCNLLCMLQIAILGGAEVGKSSLARRFVVRNFKDCTKSSDSSRCVCICANFCSALYRL